MTTEQERDLYPEVTTAKFPPKVREILTQGGRNASQLEKEFEAALNQGGSAKAQAVQKFYGMFDRVLNTNQYGTVLASFDRRNESDFQTPNRNEAVNTGLMAPRKSGNGIINGENLPANITNPPIPDPAQPQPGTQPAEGASPGMMVSPQSLAQPEGPDPNADMGYANIALRSGWNSILDRARGLGQAILGGSFFLSDVDDDDADPKMLGLSPDQQLTVQEILPTDSTLKKKIKMDINRKIEEDKKFKNSSKAMNRWFDENLKADLPKDIGAPIYYDRELGTVNTDKMGDIRSWVSMFTGSTAGMVVDYATAVAAAKAAKGKNPAAIKAIKNSARAFSFVGNSLQMFPGYLQDGLDNGLSYGDALKVAAPLAMVNGAVELVGLEFMMKGKGVGKEQAKVIVRDVLNASAKSAIKQLAKKEITIEAFQETIKKTAMEAFKELGSKDKFGATKVILDQFGKKIGRVARYGSAPEMAEEIVQEGIELGAKESYNKYVASKGAKPGEGKYDTNVGESITNGLLGASVAAFAGGGMAMAYSNPKLHDQTMFAYANSDIRHQIEGGAANLNDIKTNGKIFKKIEQWRDSGEFDIQEGGQTKFDKEAYDQVVQNANLMYDTAWDFKDYGDFDDMARYDMFQIAKTRQDLSTNAAEIQGIKDQIAQIDGWLADPSTIEADEYGNVPNPVKLEVERAKIVQSLGPLNPETGKFVIEEKQEAASAQLESIFKESIPAINDVETRRLGRSFLYSGQDAVLSLDDPATDPFTIDRETTLADGTVIVRSTEEPHTNTFYRKLVSEPIAGTVMDQLTTGRYKPVNRVKFSTAPIDSFTQFREAMDSPNQALARDTTRQYNVGTDSAEILDVGKQIVAQMKTLPDDPQANIETIDKLLTFYDKIAAHPDAIDDGVVQFTREEFFNTLGYPLPVETVEETEVGEEGAETAPESTPAAEGSKEVITTSPTTRTEPSRPNEIDGFALPGGAPIANVDISENRTAQPIPTPPRTIQGLIGQPITYQGRRANLSLDGKTVIASPIGTNEEYEIGNIDEIGNQDSLLSEIAPETTIAQVNDDGTVTVRDEVYRNGYSNPLSAINRNKAGDITSVTLDTIGENGKSKKRTFRGQAAQDIAYEIILKENSKNDDTERQFNEFAEGNEFIQQEILASEVTDAAQGEAESNIDAVPGSPEPATVAATGTTDSTVAQNEIPQQPADSVDPAATSALESEYIATRESLEPLGDIEQRSEQLRQTIGSADEIAEDLQTGEVEGADILGLIRAIESVVDEAGRVDEQISASTVQLSDENVEESSDSGDSQEGTAETSVESTPEEVPLKLENVPLTKISTDVDRFQNREAEFSESSVQSIVNAANSKVKGKQFDFTKFDPVRLWVDPKDGKTYVLAGHSRTEAFKRLKEAGNTRFKNIPAIYMNHLTEAEAIDFAVNQSNTLATQETDIEGAAAWRRLRESGQSDSQIRVNIGNRANKARIELLSYLKPNGPVMNDMRATVDGSASNTTRINQIAEFIGAAYKTFGDQLSASHENEMYQYLSENKVGQKITRRPDFIDKMDNIVNNLAYNKEKPLNLANRVSRGYAQTNAEQQYDDLIAERDQVEQERASAITKSQLEDSIRKLRVLDQKIIEANAKVQEARVLDRNQTSLFKFSDPNTTEDRNQIFPVLNQIGKAFPNIILNVPSNQEQYVMQLNANPANRTIFKVGDNVPYGYINPLDGSVNLDPSRLNSNTALHEYGHIWVAMAEQNNPELYAKGIDLVRNGKYVEDVKKSENYSALNQKQILDEALATAIGDKGESFLLERRKKNFKEWLNDVFNDVKKFFGLRNLSPEQIQNLDLEAFTNGVIADLLSGESVSEISSDQIADIMNAADIAAPTPENEITEEELRAGADLTGEILFSWRTPAAYGTRPDEQVGDAAFFRDAAFRSLPAGVEIKSAGEFTQADKNAIESIRTQTGWEFQGIDRNGDQRWENDISKPTNVPLKRNEFLFTDDNRIIYSKAQNPGSGVKSVLAQNATDGIKLLQDSGKTSADLLFKAMKTLRTMNIESVVELIDTEKGLFTQLIKNVKRNGERRRNLARTLMMDDFMIALEKIAPFSTFGGTTIEQVKKIEVPVIMEIGGRVVQKKVYMPVATAFGLARAHQTQMAMPPSYLTRKDEFGVEDTHSSLVLDDRHFNMGGRIMDPSNISLLYGQNGLRKGATFLFSELEEINAAGQLEPLMDGFDREAATVSILMTNADINRLVSRFTRGTGAEPGEVEAYQAMTKFFNNRQVTDLLAEENDQFLNPAKPFQRVSNYAPITAYAQQRADAAVNSFNPSLEDSRKLHERINRPDGLVIQDDARNAKFYLEAVGNILGYGRLVHNVKNIRDAIAIENADQSTTKDLVAYLDTYIEDVQNFQQKKANEISNAAFIKFINTVYNKNTRFIFGGNGSIALKQISTYTSAYGQGFIKDKYLVSNAGNMVKYATGAFADSIGGAGATVNTTTGQGMTRAAIFGSGRVVGADMVDYITGKNISNPAQKLRHLKRFATIIDRVLYGNSKYITGVDFQGDEVVRAAQRNGTVAVGIAKQGAAKVEAFFEEHFMAPMRRTDRAVIFGFLDAAIEQATDEGFSGEALDAKVAEMVENTLFATNQMNDISDTTSLQRAPDGWTKMITVYTGQTQKLFNNLIQTLVQWNKYGKHSSTPAAVRQRMKDRMVGAIVSNVGFVPLWNAMSEIGWGIFKALLAGAALKEPAEYIVDGLFSWLRSLGSIVPGWTEQISSVVLSHIDNQKWTQSLLEMPGIDSPENTLEALTNVVAIATGIKDGDMDKSLDKLTYDMTKFMAMWRGIPKVIHDAIYPRIFGQKDEKSNLTPRPRRRATDDEDDNAEIPL